MALLGPERQRPTVFYSSSFSVWRNLVGSGAGPRRSRAFPSMPVGQGLGGTGDVLCLVAGGRRLSGAVEILPHVAGRVGPRLSR